MNALKIVFRCVWFVIFGAVPKFVAWCHRTDEKANKLLGWLSK